MIKNICVPECLLSMFSWVFSVCLSMSVSLCLSLSSLDMVSLCHPGWPQTLYHPTIP